MSAKRLLAQVYRRPYVVIFAAAAGLSAHGLYTAAVELGHIPGWLAWSYVAIVDLLAVSAYRTWRTAAQAGRHHWAGVVAAGAAAGTVAMNVIAGHPGLAAGWAGPAIAGFPPVAALLATALAMAEQRLRPTSTAAEEQAVGLHVPASATVTAHLAVADHQAGLRADDLHRPDRPAVTVTATPRSSRSLPAAPSADADSGVDTGEVVADHLDAGGRVTDPELTATVAARLGVSDRTARRRLAPFRAQPPAADPQAAAAARLSTYGTPMLTGRR